MQISRVWGYLEIFEDKYLVYLARVQHNTWHHTSNMMSITKTALDKIILSSGIK